MYPYFAGTVIETPYVVAVITIHVIDVVICEFYYCRSMSIYAVSNIAKFNVQSWCIHYHGGRLGCSLELEN